MALRKQLKRGGLKAAVAWAAGSALVMAFEAFRTQQYELAVGLTALSAVAFFGHEILSQYQFAFEDEFRALLDNLPEKPTPDDADTTDEE